MRTLTMDAALVAGPSLAGSAAAVYGSERVLEWAADGRWLGNPFAFLPLAFVLGYVLTWILYYVFRGLLQHRALSTSRGRSMMMFLAALAVGFGLLYDPLRAVAFGAAAAGAAWSLKLLRQRPSRNRLNEGQAEAQ